MLLWMIISVRLFGSLTKLLFDIGNGAHDFEDSKKLIVKSAALNMYWRLGRALGWDRLSIILAVTIGFGALGLHKRISDLKGATHYKVTHESLKPLSSVWVTQVHDHMSSIGVLLRHVLVGFHSVRLWFNWFENVYYSFKHFLAQLLFYYLIERLPRGSFVRI